MKIRYYITKPFDWWGSYLIRYTEKDEQSCLIELYDCFSVWSYDFKENDDSVKEFTKREILLFIAWYDCQASWLPRYSIEDEQKICEIKSYDKYQFITQSNNELQLDANVYIHLMKCCDDVIPDKYHPWRSYTNIYLKNYDE